jgi:nicotinamidase-related amidase
MTRTLWVATLLMAVAGVAGAEEEAAVAGRPALLVIDIQNAYLPMMDQEGLDRSMRYINGYIDLFRAHDLPVVLVYHTDPEHGPPVDSEGFAFPESVHVQPGDPRIVKNHPSAFTHTELEQLLEDLGVDTVFLTGLSATGCALATYYDTHGRDLRAFMVRGTLMSPDLEHTRTVEDFTGAVGYRAVEYMLQHAAP